MPRGHDEPGIDRVVSSLTSVIRRSGEQTSHEPGAACHQQHHAQADAQPTDRLRVTERADETQLGDDQTCGQDRDPNDEQTHHPPPMRWACGGARAAMTPSTTSARTTATPIAT